MNRLLIIPAGCCLLTFAALLTALHGAGGRETAAEPTRSGRRGTIPSARAPSASEAANANRDVLLSSQEAEQVLTKLAGEYLRPWRQWETSPRHLYSRAAPGPIPTISATVKMSPDATGPSDSFLVATISVTTGKQSQAVPCVVDRVTKQVRFFADGQWLTADEWVKKGPLPRLTKS